MKKSNKKRTLGLLGTLILSVLISGCSNSNEKEINNFDDLNSIHPTIALDEVFGVTEKMKEIMPNCKIVYYDDAVTGLTNLESNRWQGLLTPEEIGIEAIKSRKYDIKMLDEVVNTIDCALGLSLKSPIPDYINRVNNTIRELKADGTVDKIYDNWFTMDGEMRMPTFAPKQGAPTIRCVTFGQIKPCSYFEGNELKGFDIEIAMRIADRMNCNITFETAPFPSMLMGLSMGSYDMISSNLFITNDSKDSFEFSEVTAVSRIRMLVRDKSGNRLQYTSLNEIKNVRIGVVTSTVFSHTIQEKFPNSTIVHLNTVGDAILALQTNKIDAFVYDGPVLKYAANSNKGVGVIPENIEDEDYYFATAKTQKGIDLANEFDEWLVGYKESGEAKKAYNFWISDDEPKLFDFDSLPATNGSFNAGVYYDARPESFLYNGKNTGFPNELLYEFCKAKGYKCNLIDQGADNFVTALATGKIDIAATFISYTEERAQVINYTDSICSGGVSVLVRKANYKSSDNFFTSIGDSFYKTFIKENRYQMIFKGLGTTLLITLFGFILANLFGALFCFFGLSNKKGLRAIFTAYSYIIQGTPIVVIMMILFYIVFGSTRLPGEIIAMLGFGLVSGAGLAQLFKGGIEGVDKGQKEASLALGFTRTQTFTGIVIPQAARSVLPSFFSELIGLLKSTSIVGYISVMDLTKMGDIIRSATFEPFFPLIAIAVIYFGITAILLFILRQIQKLLAKKTYENKGAAK